MNPKDPTQIVKLCSKHLTHWVTSAHFNMLNNTRMCAIAIHSKPVPSPSQHITVWLQSDLFKKWCSPVGYVRYPHTLKSWWQIKWPISFPALPAENMHILIMHWCASWCSRRAISPSGFFLELGFTGFFFSHGSTCYSQSSLLAISERCIYQGQWDLAGRQKSQYVDRATTRQPRQHNLCSSLTVVY